MRRTLSAFLAALTLSATVMAGQFSPGMEDFVQAQSPDASVRALLALKTQADITTLDATLHDVRATLADRHDQVVTLLMNTAQETQAELVDDLEDLQREGKVDSFHPYWIINGIAIQAPVSTLRALANHPSVERIDPDLPVELIEPAPNTNPKFQDGATYDTRGIGITPGVTAIQADRVWYELGIDGTGALVACMDTGVKGTHVSLSNRWRGNTEPASECWLDVVHGGTTTPDDQHYHGTHVMGTIAGVADDDSIGVCPGALWIAANPIDQGAGGSFDSDIVLCLEWFADPDGNAGTLDDVPDVVQNSWGVNEGFAGYEDCDSRWWTAIDNCEAAGVVLTWSAGNEGAGATTLRSPADRATTPYNCFSVGSTITSSPYTISSFSSRGPSGCGGSYTTKPEVSAPGSDIYSADPGGGYQYLSGTSMAGPHVAGVVGLMRAANPDLDVTTIKEILMNTATDLGAVGEDNDYGHGLINAYEAVLAVMSGYGTVEGTLTSDLTGLPIAGALVEVVGESRFVNTDAAGTYSMSLPADNYTLHYSAFGYSATDRAVVVPEDGSVTQNVVLAALPTAVLSGYVYDEATSAPLAGATVGTSSYDLPSVSTNGSGFYTLNVPVGYTYTFKASYAGYGLDSWTVAFNSAQSHNFYLPELSIETFESGDFSLMAWEMSGSADWFISSDSYEGTYAAQSGDITDSQTSTMFFTGEVAEVSDISFFYQISTESGYDFLKFYIDGTLQGEWAGTVGWTQATYSVGTGEHDFTWTYYKDGSVSSGSDAVWVDYIVLPVMGMPEDHEAPLVTHVPHANTSSTGPWDISATVTDESSLASVDLEYRINGGAWSSVAMTAAGDVYSALIAETATPGSAVEYQIVAVDASPFSNGTTEGPFSFTILMPAGLEYCQDFESGLDDFTAELIESGGSNWTTSTYGDQGSTAYIQYSSSTQVDHARLISPVFDCSGQATVNLEFWQYLRYGYSGAWTDAEVRGSVDGGNTWTVMIAEWHADNAPVEIILEGIEAFDITAWAAGEEQVCIAFEFADLYDWYWHVDDVCVTGTLAFALEAPEVSAHLSGSDVLLTWDAVPGAGSYAIYVTDDMNGTWNHVGNTSDLYYLQTPGADATALYRVSAVSAARASETQSIDPMRNRKWVLTSEDTKSK
jgi:subtilisin family serine protease